MTSVYYPIRTTPGHQCPRCGHWFAKLYPTMRGYALCWRCKEHGELDDALAWAQALMTELAAEYGPLDEKLYPVPDDGDDDQGWYGTIPHV